MSCCWCVFSVFKRQIVSFSAPISVMAFTARPSAERIESEITHQEYNKPKGRSYPFPGARVYLLPLLCIMHIWHNGFSVEGDRGACVQLPLPLMDLLILLTWDDWHYIYVIISYEVSFSFCSVGFPPRDIGMYFITPCCSRLAVSFPLLLQKKEVHFHLTLGELQVANAIEAIPLLFWTKLFSHLLNKGRWIIVSRRSFMFVFLAL